jgi:hypothetical protein
MVTNAKYIRIAPDCHLKKEMRNFKQICALLGSIVRFSAVDQKKAPDEKIDVY